MDKIYLAPASVRRIIAICDEVEQHSADNEKTVKMCEGIRDWVKRCDFLSEKQAKWVAHNANFHGLSVPEELAALAASLKAGSGPMQAERESMAVLSEIRDRLQRIEAMLKRQCSKSR